MAVLPALLCAMAALLACPITVAGAATQTRTDPSDSPAGAVGKADVRTIDWDVNDSSATVKISLDASTYTDCSGGPCVESRSPFGMHVLLDTDADDLADVEVAASRSADGVSVDLTLRNLDRTLSSSDCQALDGSAIIAPATVSTTVTGGTESFTFAFDPTVVAGHLATFRWAAFAQAPADPASGGSWDVVPDAANLQPAAPNPGDRRCDPTHSGLQVSVKDGVTFPDPPAPPPPAQTDSDGDGVPDSTDQCPSEAASTTNGCPSTVAPPGPTPPDPLDTIAPVVRLSGRGTQRLLASLTIACPDEACTARVTGTVHVTPSRAYAIKPAMRSIAKGGTVTLRLKLSAAARRAIAKALRRGRRVTVKVTVAAADAAGNTTTRTRRIKLKR